MAIFHVSGMRVLDDVGIMETGEQKFLKSLCVLRMQIILRYWILGYLSERKETVEKPALVH